MKTRNKREISEKIISVISIAIIFIVLDCQQADAQSKSWPVPPDAASMKNPIAVDSESLASAKILYGNYCSPCHGDKGQGDGYAGGKLDPKPAVHTSAFVQNETDGALFYKMSEGRKVMPSYKVALTETERWELVNYIRELGKEAKK